MNSETDNWSSAGAGSRGDGHKRFVGTVHPRLKEQRLPNNPLVGMPVGGLSRGQSPAMWVEFFDHCGNWREVRTKHCQLRVGGIEN